jgi:hypothetical protein
MTPLPQNGLIAFVKRDCPTCTLIEPAIERVAGNSIAFTVVSQDDPQFPARVANLIDDRELDLSYINGIEFTPTLIRVKDGREAERVVGWDRSGWRRLTGLPDLGSDLPELQPG